MERKDDEHLQVLIEQVMAELKARGLLSQAAESARTPPQPRRAPAAEPLPDGGRLDALQIDLPDPAGMQVGGSVGVARPVNADGLAALVQSTPARIGVGRAGARYRTGAWLRFLADHAITQDALMQAVDERLLEQMGFFSVQTEVTGGKEEYLLRPDLGRRLSEAAAQQIRARCQPKPNVQICAGDGLSASAIEANLPRIFPVMKSGFESARLSVGTPFFIRFCRVGVMNDIGALLEPDVLVLLIGERPGLGRAESMSAYMAYRPRPGHTDADRDVICNIYEAGGTNPLEAGAYAVQMAQKLIQYRASGVRLRLAETGKEGAHGNS